MERNAARIAAGEPRALVERWNAEWKPAFRDRLATLRPVAPADLDDAALRAHLGELIVLFGRLHDVYFRLTGAAIVLLAPLVPDHYHAMHETAGLIALYSGLGLVWYLTGTDRPRSVAA